MRVAPWIVVVRVFPVGHDLFREVLVSDSAFAVNEDLSLGEKSGDPDSLVSFLTIL